MYRIILESKKTKTFYSYNSITDTVHVISPEEASTRDSKHLTHIERMHHLTDLGKVALKDIEEPEHGYDLYWAFMHRMMADYCCVHAAVASYNSLHENGIDSNMVGVVLKGFYEQGVIVRQSFCESSLICA